MKTLLPVAALVALFAACAQPDKPAITAQSLNQRFVQAWNSKQADSVIAMLDENVQFAQGQTRFSGKADVAEKWVRATLPTISDLRLSPRSSVTDAKTAYEAGTYTVDALPETPAEPHGIGEGNVVLLWRKANDESWKLSYAQLEGLPVRAK
jgi:ketosteroid isomerase-like protein